MALPQDRSDLRFGAGHGLLGRRARHQQVDVARRTLRDASAVAAGRHHDAVVLVFPAHWRRPLRREKTDDAERVAADTDGSADRIAVSEKLLGRRLPDEAHLRLHELVALGPELALGDG